MVALGLIARSLAVAARMLTIGGMVALPAFAADLATVAQEKLDGIADKKVARGAVVNFSTAEINAWLQAKAAKSYSKGIRNIVVTPGAGVADGGALVDFLKLQESKGRQLNFLIAKLIEGEKQLKVSIRVESSNAKCTVFLTRVELSGVAISGGALDLILSTFFKPMFPDAHINEPFDLSDNIERLEVIPSGMRVYIKK